MLGWFRHYIALIGYTVLGTVMGPLMAVMPRAVRQAFKVGGGMHGLQGSYVEQRSGSNEI